MRRLWKKLCWVCGKRSETVFFLALGGCLAALSRELDGFPVTQGMWNILAVVLCGPFIGSLCSAPSFKEEKKMEQDKIRWRDRRLCNYCKENRMVALSITASVTLILLLIGKLCSFGIALVAHVAGCSFLSYIFLALRSCRMNSCANCKEASMQAAVRRKEREAQMNDTKSRPTKLCEGCWCASILAFLVGVAVVVCGPWFVSTNTDAYAVAVGGSSLFILMLAPIALRKHCKDCCLENEEQRPTKVAPFIAQDLADVRPPMKPDELPAFQQKARALLQNIHLQVSGEQIPASITHEECERRIRAYLEVKKNAQDLLLLGKYAPDVAAAIGCPYTLVRDVLLRAGKRMHLELLNNTLILRSYGYPEL